MYLREVVEAPLHALVHAGDDFDLRFAEVGRDAGVRQGRAQGGGVRRHRQRAVLGHAQALFFNASADVQQPLAADRVDSLLDMVHLHCCVPS
ncbi:hypothetical protein D3C71_1697430 [compost metagenome]